jgi:hypothetical protein
MTHEELTGFARSLLAENTAMRIQIRETADQTVQKCIEVLEGMHEAYGSDEAPYGWHEAIDNCIIAIQQLKS